MNYIKRCVENLVKRFSTRDPFELCGLLGIFVFYPDLPDTVKGLYYNVDGYKLIGINQQLDFDERRMVCAHELGHAMLHPDMNLFFAVNYTGFPTEKFEKQADYFCACLLIDEPKLTALKKENERLTVNDVSSLCRLPDEIVRLWLRLEQ